jgi:hypothetical protein
MFTTRRNPMTANPTDSDLVSGRWEPCHAFAPEFTDSQVCGECGWLHDDHERDAVVRRLPLRVPSSDRPRRLAS